MNKLVKLSECSDMTENEFNQCLVRVNEKAFMENPTQALIDAGVRLKEGVTLKFVENEEEAKLLPSNVFPLIHPQKNNEELSIEALDKVAGGKNCTNVWHEGEHTHKGSKVDESGKVIYTGIDTKYTGGG